MLKVGITGGIGSGKTIVCTVFKHLGIPVYNADISAKKLMEDDEILMTGLKKQFGSEIYVSKNVLNKKKLAEIVFNNPGALQKLNSIVHPAVRKDFERWSHDNSSALYIIEEAAILFESGSNQHLDFVITVTAPEEIRIKRVMHRDGVSHEYVMSIIKNQWSENEKIKKSDFIITNDDEHLVIPQVLELHNRFLSSLK